MSLSWWADAAAATSASIPGPSSDVCAFIIIIPRSGCCCDICASVSLGEVRGETRRIKVRDELEYWSIALVGHHERQAGGEACGKYGSSNHASGGFIRKMIDDST